MKKITLAILLLAAYASSASATTITFSEAGVNGSSFTSSDGLVLAEWVWGTGQNDGHSHVTCCGDTGDYERGHGQTYQGLRFSSVNNSPLSLLSFDFQGDWWVSTLNDGSGTQYTNNGAWATQAINFTSAGYIYVYASGAPAGGCSVCGLPGDLDNVTFGAVVPEPASLGLLGLGLAGIGFARRRKIA